MKGLTLTMCPSKILDKRWKQREKEIHKQKLRSVKSTIRDQYQSVPFGAGAPNNIMRNGKKEALMERKYIAF